MITLKRLREVLDYDPKRGIFRWKITLGSRANAGSRAGSRHPDGYRKIAIDRCRYTEQRLAWFYVRGEWPDGHLDHKNCRRDDNRIENLRRATPSQNKANSPLRADNPSGFKGVYRRGRRWQAGIRRGRLIHLGYFATAQGAAAAYDKAAKRLFGKFALTNQQLRRAA